MLAGSRRFMYGIIIKNKSGGHFLPPQCPQTEVHERRHFFSSMMLLSGTPAAQCTTPAEKTQA